MQDRQEGMRVRPLRELWVLRQCGSVADGGCRILEGVEQRVYGVGAVGAQSFNVGLAVCVDLVFEDEGGWIRSVGEWYGDLEWEGG